MPGPLQEADTPKCSRSSAGQVSRPLSDGLEPHMAAVHPISLWKQVPSCGDYSSIAALVSPSRRAASVDLTACCHHLCGCGGRRSSTPLPCCSLPLGLAMDPGSLTARPVTRAGSLQLALFLPWPWGTAGRSSGPQLCDTPQAPMAGPAAEWLRVKVTQSLGGQRGAAPPAPGQLSFAMHCPSTGLAQLFPPMHQLHPSSSGPPKEQPVWVLGVFLPAGQLCSLAQGAGWCGLVSYLQEAFLTPGFSYGGLLNFQLYSHCLGISTL